MNRFEILLRKHDVDLRVRPLYYDVAMTKWPEHNVSLTLCSGLPDELRILGTAIMLGVLETGGHGQIFRFRFPLPADTPQQRRKLHQMRLDYRRAMRWAGDYLIPDTALEAMGRGELDEQEYCRDHHIPHCLFVRRVERWRQQQRGLTPFLFAQ